MNRLAQFLESAGILLVGMLALPLLIAAQYKLDRMKEQGEMDDDLRPF